MDTQIEVSAQREKSPAGGGAFGERGAAATVWAEMVEGRRRLVADVVDGRADEVDLGDLTLAVELDVPHAQSDHMRLLRAASLAIQYQREEPAGRSEAALRKRLALALRSGAPLYVVRDALGHSSVATTQIYLSPCRRARGGRRDALEDLGPGYAVGLLDLDPRRRGDGPRCGP